MTTAKSPSHSGQSTGGHGPQVLGSSVPKPPDGVEPEDVAGAPLLEGEDTLLLGDEALLPGVEPGLLLEGVEPVPPPDALAEVVREA